MERKLVLGNLAGVACMIIWSLNFPLMVAILKSWDALPLTPLRLLLAGLTVLIAAVFLGQASIMQRLAGDRSFQIASLGFALSTLCFIIGQSRIDAVSGAVLLSSMPIFSALMGWKEGTETLGLRLCIAVLLTVAGGALTSMVSAQGSDQQGSLSGVLIMLVGVVSYVWYSRRMVFRFADAPDVGKTAASMLLSAVPCLFVVAAAAGSGMSLKVDWSMPTMAMVLVMSCLSVGLSSVLFLWTGRQVGVTVASMHHNLVPFYVIAMAAIAGSIVTVQHFAGAVLVISGAVLAQVRPRSTRVGVTQPVAPGRETDS